MEKIENSATIGKTKNIENTNVLHHKDILGCLIKVLNRFRPLIRTAMPKLNIQAAVETKQIQQA